ncbi:putative F-box domain, leucine-rich repeat domain, L domain-containing protein [Medicago truncatula]|uniref:Putative F-box domain, leucine-rich repeat domain, L domain-containing protein n=1 Tax=Medicago truncatula TaxID=3880 RepID=A0A396G9Z1_MEDTR|nr:putative F-box domain, leucine-rich repeat domain, L domain-containing protein [Medicago truncatula]
MESGLTITAQKHRKNKSTCEDDLFYKLTESLITHIISFLPTKDAVRTCVLSKQWKHRWTFLTKLSLLDHHDSSPSSNFVSFVTRALLLTRTETISLSLSGQYDLSLLDAWFGIMLLDRTLKNLRIHSHFKLPFSTFASNSLFKITLLLEKLELHPESISRIKVPSKPDIHFGNLKHLKLCKIKFKTDSTISPDHIDLRFPHLTKFEAINCSWFLDSGAVYVHAPLLQSINIKNGSCLLYGEDNSAINFVSSLHLQEFTFAGYCIPQGIIIPFPYYAYATTAIEKGPVYSPNHSIFGLLSQFSNAKQIRFQVFGDLAPPPPPQLCVFSMLTNLEVFFVSVDVLLALLQKSPVLKILTLKGIHEFAEERLNSAVVPKCFASLEDVNLEVDGVQHELFLAKFFMEKDRWTYQFHTPPYTPLMWHGYFGNFTQLSLSHPLLSLRSTFLLLLALPLTHPPPPPATAACLPFAPPLHLMVGRWSSSLFLIDRHHHHLHHRSPP